MKIEILCKTKPAESINHMMLDFYRISYAIKSSVVEENSGLPISGLSIHTSICSKSAKCSLAVRIQNLRFSRKMGLANYSIKNYVRGKPQCELISQIWVDPSTGMKKGGPCRCYVRARISIKCLGGEQSPILWSKH